MCASEWDSTRCSSCCFWLWRYQFTSVIDSRWSCEWRQQTGQPLQRQIHNHEQKRQRVAVYKPVQKPYATHEHSVIRNSHRPHRQQPDTHITPWCHVSRTLKSPSGAVLPVISSLLAMRGAFCTYSPPLPFSLWSPQCARQLHNCRHLLLHSSSDSTWEIKPRVAEAEWSQLNPVSFRINIPRIR
jgi:hypothetical protein